MPLKVQSRVVSPVMAVPLALTLESIGFTCIWVLLTARPVNISAALLYATGCFHNSSLILGPSCKCRSTNSPRDQTERRILGLHRINAVSSTAF